LAGTENAKQLKDSTLSQAVKIIMNSFYGVLGTPGCRFYDPRFAGTITRRIGHWILIFSREFIESEGHQVIYGDTDSLFIHFGEEYTKNVPPHRWKTIKLILKHKYALRLSKPRLSFAL
jgi:DNA polymerase-2